MNVEDDSACVQATLPVRLVGLGIHTAVQLAPFTYSASAVGWSNLIACHLLSSATTYRSFR